MIKPNITHSPRRSIRLHPLLVVALMAICLGATGLMAQSPQSHPIHTKGNPIVGDGSYYAADAAPLSYDGKLYIYFGHDEPEKWQGGFVMKEYGVLATDNPTSGDWELYQANLDPDKVFDWATGNNAYAGQVARGVDGRFYWYVPVEWKNTEVPNRMVIGVAVSDSPVGPWTDPIGKPLLTWLDVFGNDRRGQEVIDPHVFTDSDGTVYLYWGSWYVARAVKLAPSMTATDGEIIRMSGLDAFFEAPWVFKRDDTYYLVYDWKRGGSKWTPSNYQAAIAYATSSSPTGPWQFQDIILSGTSSTTVHPSIVEHNGRWWVTYHTKDAKDGGHFRRSVAIDEVHWNGKTILPVKPTWADNPAYRLTKNLAVDAELSASFTEQPPMTLGALNDGRPETAILPPDMWGNYRGKTNSIETDWIQVTWDIPVRIDGVGIQFHQDRNWIRPPAKWQLEAQDDKGQWVPVTVENYPTNVDRWLEVTFSPVTTKTLRATFWGRAEGTYFHSVAATEWEVYAVQAENLVTIPVKTRVGNPLQLPSTVELPFGEAGNMQVPVIWRNVEPKQLEAAGTVIVEGRAIGQAAGFIKAEVTVSNNSQSRRRGRPAPPPTLGLDQGMMELDTPDFTLKLVKASQTVAALEPKDSKGFDFTPADQLEQRAGNGFHHLGDINLRTRSGNQSTWTELSSAAARQPVTALPVSGTGLAAADLSPTLPADCPLRIVRTWAVDEGRLVLTFAISNQSQQDVEIGALGMPLIFNNHITRRSLDEAHAVCSFSDPAIGLDGGYVQVTRLSGQGPALVVVPQGKTPLEGYNPLLNDRTRRSQTFEGFYEWMPHTQALADTDWKDAQPWNKPSAVTLAPGQSRSYGLRFLLAPEIRKVEETLAADQRPVAVGLPGYIVPTDIDASLFINYKQPIASIEVFPLNTLHVTENKATANGWQHLTIQGKQWGRARLLLTYTDGLTQAIHYRVIKPAEQVVKDMGHFLTTAQWYDNPKDPFGRSPSVMNYNREKNAIVLEDNRVWHAGLGDEGGTGGWVSAIMKQLGQPDKAELEKLQRFMDECLWGRLQVSEGEQKYGVRKSLFYYEPNDMPAGTYSPAIRYGGWMSWDKKQAYSLGRTFNYPHIAAAHWVFYRLARHYNGLVTNHPWQWYLEKAYQTTMVMPKFGRHYFQFGLMEGSVFIQILRDLQEEGWTEQAEQLEAMMKTRAEHWRELAYPFGSEMAWDSTGQEEVYGWCKYFGYEDKAEVTLNAVLGYMPTVPHWGYNGNARRYWDFIYGAAPGPTSRIERQIHHYGSSMNAVPVLHAYRENPDDFYLLRVGYGGAMGTLTNIDQEGFASAAFHAWPNTLKHDATTGDFGPNFFGHAWNTGTYVIRHPEFGWQALGGNVTVKGDRIKVTPLDSFRQRCYVAPLGLWLTLDCGHFESLEINMSDDSVAVSLAPATESLHAARLRIEQPAKVTGVGTIKPLASLPVQRNAYYVPLSSTPVIVNLKSKGPVAKPRVTAPPESFFELVSKRPRWGRRRNQAQQPAEDLQIYRNFYKKYLDVQGMPVVAAEVVADQALQRTYEIVTHMLAGRPDILQSMVERSMYLTVIGKDQGYCDLPENRNVPNKDYMNERVRGTGGHPTSFGEENLLSLPIDRYDDESIGVHEFCHTIDSTLRRVEPEWNDRRMAAYNNALEKGLYKDTYAIGNPAEYWCEIAQAYFNCNRVNNWNHGPIGKREQLKIYDPEGYELCRSTFNLSPEQDWRYTWLQPLPNVIEPPAQFTIDPYYTKFTWAREFTVIGHQASDEALLKANDTIRKLFAYRHDILKALMAEDLKLVVLGPDESLADLPEYPRLKTASVDLLGRYLEYTPGIKILAVSQENVLSDINQDMYGTESQVMRVFAKAIYGVTATRPVDPNWESRRDVQQYELRVQRMDIRFDQQLKAAYEAAIEKGLWKGTVAIHDRTEYWTEGLLAYFDAVGQGVAPNDADRPITTREMLKAYDPGLYQLVDQTMAYTGKVDWRYTMKKS